MAEPPATSDGGASGDSDGGATGNQSSCAAPVLTAQVIETYTVSGSYTVAGDECDAGGVYYELRKSADTEWTSSNRVSAGSRSFIHGGLQAVSYDFRVRVIDNRGVGRPDSEIQNAWITDEQHRHGHARGRHGGREVSIPTWRASRS